MMAKTDRFIDGGFKKVSLEKAKVAEKQVAKEQAEASASFARETDQEKKRNLEST